MDDAKVHPHPKKVTYEFEEKLNSLGVSRIERVDENAAFRTYS